MAGALRRPAEIWQKTGAYRASWKMRTPFRAVAETTQPEINHIFFVVKVFIGFRHYLRHYFIRKYIMRYGKTPYYELASTFWRRTLLSELPQLSSPNNHQTRPSWFRMAALAVCVGPVVYAAGATANPSSPVRPYAATDLQATVCMWSPPRTTEYCRDVSLAPGFPPKPGFPDKASCERGKDERFAAWLTEAKEVFGFGTGMAGYGYRVGKPRCVTNTISLDDD
jgi:hypothetical protein